jgi:hypothetical protein
MTGPDDVPNDGGKASLDQPRRSLEQPTLRKEKRTVAVPIVWQPDPNGQSALCLVEGGQPSNRLFAVSSTEMATAQPLV